MVIHLGVNFAMPMTTESRHYILNIMKATNLILLTEDDYNQLAETIANRVIQQLQGKTHNVEQPKSDDGFVFQEEAAKLLKVSLRTLIRWDKSGYLPKRHVGRRVAYRREDINRLAGAGQCHD